MCLSFSSSNPDPVTQDNPADLDASSFHVGASYRTIPDTHIATQKGSVQLLMHGRLILKGVRHVNTCLPLFFIFWVE